MFIQGNEKRNKNQLYFPMLEMFGDGQSRTYKETQSDLADHMKIEDEKLQMVYNSGLNIFEQLTNLARTQLTLDGFLKKIEVEGSRNAKWQITDKGNIALECKQIYKPLFAPWFK